MSNQVYSNPQHKYFAQPGATVWGILAGVPYAASQGTLSIPFFTPPDINQGGVAFLQNSLTGTFTAQEEGVYYLKLVAPVEMELRATGGPPVVLGKEFLFAIGIQLLTGNGAEDGVIVDWFKAQYESPAVAPETRYVANVSATVYLPQGASFRTFATNFIPDVLPATARLRITPETKFYATKLV